MNGVLVLVPERPSRGRDAERDGMSSRAMGRRRSGASSPPIRRIRGRITRGERVVVVPRSSSGRGGSSLARQVKVAYRFPRQGSEGRGDEGLWSRALWLSAEACQVPTTGVSRCPPLVLLVPSRCRPRAMTQRMVRQLVAASSGIDPSRKDEWSRIVATLVQQASPDRVAPPGDE